MSIRSHAELEKLRIIGSIVRKALDATAAAVRPGITTGELDEVGARALADNGAESAPLKVYGFPGALCISVNDEAIHGIPGARVVQSGDLVKLDLVAEKDGFYADAALTINVPPGSERGRQLAHCAERAFQQALGGARAGNRAHCVGRADPSRDFRVGDGLTNRDPLERLPHPPLERGAADVKRQIEA